MHADHVTTGVICFAALVHINFMHLAGNLLPWMAIAFLLEIRFGALRIGSLFLVSLLGAAFVSATLDSSCGLVKLFRAPRSLLYYVSLDG